MIRSPRLQALSSGVATATFSMARQRFHHQPPSGLPGPDQMPRQLQQNRLQPPQTSVAVSTDTPTGVRMAEDPNRGRRCCRPYGHCVGAAARSGFRGLQRAWYLGSERRGHRRQIRSLAGSPWFVWSVPIQAGEPPEPTQVRQRISRRGPHLQPAIVSG